MKRLFVLSVFLAVLLCGVMVLSIVIDSRLYPIKYQKEVAYVSNKFDVESAYIYSIIKTESSFNPKAVSKKGAIGLMQLMPSTARWADGQIYADDAGFSKELLYDTAINIELGTYYFKYLLNKYGVIETALACYNAGEGNMKNYISGDKSLMGYPYAETANYVEKVEKYYKIYKTKI